MRREDFREALLAIVRGRGADCAFELENVDVRRRVLELLDDPTRGLAAFLDEVGADETHVQRRVRRHGAIRQDHGNAGGPGFVQHRVPTGLDDRRKGDDVHLLRDEGAQRLDLVFLLLLRVGEAQVDVVVAAADLIDSVFAVRHSLSAPIWLKPSTMRSSFACLPQDARSMSPSDERERGEASVEFLGFSKACPSRAGYGRPGNQQRIHECRAERRQIHLEDVAGLRLDAVDEAHRRGAEEMQVHVAGHAVLRILEVVILEIRERVAHVRLAREERLLPDHRAIAADAARAFEMGGKRAGVEHRADAALAQLRMGEQ